MSPIHASKLALLLILTTGRVSPQLHVAFDPSFANINGPDGYIVPSRYWQSMCGLVNGMKLALLYSEQHSPSTYLLYWPYLFNRNS